MVVGDDGDCDDGDCDCDYKLAVTFFHSLEPGYDLRLSQVLLRDGISRGQDGLFVVRVGPG
eukprot:1362047-Lingulodinium_polyedra.AAC.1